MFSPQHRVILLAASVLAWASAPLFGAPGIRLNPAVIYNCVPDSDLGRAQVIWSGGSAAVQVQVGPGRTAMTGYGPGEGSAETGDWVSNGLTFYLVNAAGQVEAQVVAQVRCSRPGPPPVVPTGTESYFPLGVGNLWIYRLNSRNITSTYVTREITGMREVGGFDYFVMETTGPGTHTEDLLRMDPSGRIVRRNIPVVDAAESLVLDPKLAAPAEFSGPAGKFPDALLTVENTTLLRTNTAYSRAVGMVRTELTLLTGSSGGFVSSLELVEARIVGGVHLSIPAPTIGVSVESTRLDVSGNKVTNCAVPSYCAACGITGADQPNTYKPCVQARLEVNVNDAFLTQLQLVNSTGTVVYRVQNEGGPGAQLQYVQIPLYSAPNQPLPPGRYTLDGRLAVADRAVAMAATTLEIE